MFELFNEIGIMLNGPLQQIAYGYEHIPLLFAFFLGLIGAVAPCQLTGNISAMTIYGNRSLVERVPWLHIFLFVLGKIVVFSIIGLVIWLLGKEIHSTLTQMFPILRKAIGPLLILVGLFMIGLFSWRKTGKMFKIPTKFKDSYLGSFLMGASFTLAFCPTMFVLFTNLNASCIRNIIWICITFCIWNWNLTSTFINYFSYLVFWGKWHYIKEKQKNRVTSTKTCRSYHSCYRYSGYFNLLVKEVNYV